MIRINLLNDKIPQNAVLIIEDLVKHHAMFGFTDMQCDSCIALRDEIHIAHMRVVELEQACDGYRENLKTQQRISRTLFSKLQHIREIVNSREPF